MLPVSIISKFLHRHKQAAASTRFSTDASLKHEPRTKNLANLCILILFVGALKTLGANKDLALPIKLFELSDVVLLAPDKEVGSKNQRQLVAVHCSKDSGFEVIHGLLNRVMEILGIPLRQGITCCYHEQSFCICDPSLAASMHMILC